MTTRKSMSFEAPGAGTWKLDKQHNPNPISRFKQGFGNEFGRPSRNRTFARYGELKYFTGANLHGFSYLRSNTVGVPPGSSNAPNLENAFVAERVKRARRAYIDKLWQKDLERWDNVGKPDSIARNLELAAVDVDSLDHDGLIEHLSSCRLNMGVMMSRHHMFTRVSEVPKGIFILDVTEWTGMRADELFFLFDGASPVSVGATPEFLAVVDAVQKDDDALRILTSDQTSDSRLDQLRDLPGLVGESMNRFWLMDGHRLTSGFDLQSQCAFELPNTLVDRINNAVKNGIEDRSASAMEGAKRIRELVPTEHRAAFDAELEDARNLSRLKDERGIFNDIWGTGIMRKAILGAGRRLVEDGLLSDSENLIEADWEEMQSLLLGSPVVSDEELIARRKERMALTWRDAPARLGPPPEPEAPIADLPPEADRMYKADAILRSAFSASPVSKTAPDLTGISASKGNHEGRARIAVGDYKFDQINPGDVLVTSTHSEAFNAVAGRVGAIITDTGGMLSHLSIVSRELGIPCVVACKNATTAIQEGALVRVDGGTGKVTILA